MLPPPKCRSRPEQAVSLINGQRTGIWAHKAVEAPCGLEPAMKTSVRQMMAHARGQPARQYDGVGSMRERQIASDCPVREAQPVQRRTRQRHVAVKRSGPQVGIGHELNLFVVLDREPLIDVIEAGA